MNNLLLKIYLKTGNVSKIRALSEEDFRKLYKNVSLTDKIRLAHIRGQLITNLDNFDLLIGGRPLYEILDDENSLIFYLELLNYINHDIKYNGKTIKRFNIPSWKNRLEESDYLNFSINGIYELIGRNQDFFINLLDSNLDFRSMFFNNVSFEGNMYELKIEKILSFEKVANYLCDQKEMSKFYNKRCASILYSLNASFFRKLPDKYKFLIGYHGFNDRDKGKIKSVLTDYFSSFLSDNQIDDILNLYKNISHDNIAALISFIMNEHEFYKKYEFLLNYYFDGDSDRTLFFCRKYFGSELFDEICFNEIPEVKEKLVFLSFANRLKGIDNLEAISNISIDELKKIEDDFSNYREVKDEVRVFGKNDFVCLNYEREIIVIYSDGEIDDREVTSSHDEIIYDFVSSYNYNGCTIFRDMVIELASRNIIILLFEGDSVVCTLPNCISEAQRDSLKYLLEKFNPLSKIGFCFVDEREMYVMNSGEMMNSNFAIDEVSRIK